VISVVVPVHNEERTLGLLYEELEAALEPQQDA
jgi:glycosyltransferase involved in cell wall biosynthesis